jgi:hypothetical protein
MAEKDRGSLAQFIHIRDTAAEAERITSEAAANKLDVEARAAETSAAAQAEVLRVTADAAANAKRKRAKADQLVSRASDEAAKVIEDEAAISSTLNSPYPAACATVPCSLCLRPVDRSKPHVSVCMTNFEDASEPWLVSARVVDERELAVYCHCCAEPRPAAKVFDEAELGVGA